MDGENNGKPYEQMDDLVVHLYISSQQVFCTPGWWIKETLPGK